MSNVIELKPTNINNQNQNTKEVELQQSDFITEKTQDNLNYLDQIRKDLINEDITELTRRELVDKVIEYLKKRKNSDKYSIATIQQISKRVFGVEQNKLPYCVYNNLNKGLKNSNQITKHQNFDGKKNGFEYKKP